MTVLEAQQKKRFWRSSPYILPISLQNTKHFPNWFKCSNSRNRFIRKKKKRLSKNVNSIWNNRYCWTLGNIKKSRNQQTLLLYSIEPNYWFRKDTLNNIDYRKNPVAINSPAFLKIEKRHLWPRPQFMH